MRSPRLVAARGRAAADRALTATGTVAKLAVVAHGRSPSTLADGGEARFLWNADTKINGILSPGAKVTIRYTISAGRPEPRPPDQRVEAARPRLAVGLLLESRRSARMPRRGGRSPWGCTSSRSRASAPRTPPASTCVRSTASTRARTREDFATAEMLYIDPDVCIQCGNCEPACPVTAIFTEETIPEKWKHFLQVNADWYKNNPK